MTAFPLPGDSTLVFDAGNMRYLVIDGYLSSSFGHAGIAAPLNAQFVYCPIRPVWTSGEYWACPDDRGVDCSSTAHQLTLVPR